MGVKRANGTVHRVLALLSAFAAQDRALTLPEIARLGGISADTAERYVADMLECGFLEQEVAGYRLGLAVLPLARCVADANRIRSAGVRVLAHLSGVTELNANLGVKRDGKMLYLGRAEARLWRSFRCGMGRVAPLHCSAMGKVLLAFDNPKDLPESFTGYTPNTIVDREALLRELQATRERGFATDNVEWIDGIRCLATPVRDETGKVVAAVSASGPASQVDLASEKLLLAVQSAAYEIQAQLGYRT